MVKHFLIYSEFNNTYKIDKFVAKKKSFTKQKADVDHGKFLEEFSDEGDEDVSANGDDFEVEDDLDEEQVQAMSKASKQESTDTI